MFSLRVAREHATPANPKSEWGLHPGGGGAERLPHLVGCGGAARSKLFSARTISTATPQKRIRIRQPGTSRRRTRRLRRCPRAPDRLLFDRRAIAAAKSLINQVSLPSADQLLDAITSFETALTSAFGSAAENHPNSVGARDCNGKSDFENRWPEVLSARCLRPSRLPRRNAGPYIDDGSASAYKR